MTSGPMHAQVLHEWGGEVRYETVARPSVVAGEVLIEVEACSVGLTVLNYMSGNHSRRPEDLPRIPGHEIVGRVIATADGVSPIAATAIPDAIATPLHVSRRAAIAPSDSVMVIGAAGGVGIHMVQMARVFGGAVIGI